MTETDYLDNYLIDSYGDETILYEDEFRIMYKIIKDIPTHSKKWVKRVSIIKWKFKHSDMLELDIRRYNTKDEKFGKGISFSKRELEILKSTLTDLDINLFFKDKL
jgi:hypothetical protein